MRVIWNPPKLTPLTFGHLANTEYVPGGQPYMYYLVDEFDAFLPVHFMYSEVNV